MTASRETHARIVRETLAALPLPESAEDLSDADARVFGQRAAEAGMTLQQFLDQARAEQAAMIANSDDADGIVGEIVGRRRGDYR